MIIYFFILIFCSIFPQKTLFTVSETINLWAENVLPSLLPFFILSKAILYSGGEKYFSKILSPVTNFLFIPKELSYPFAMSLFCGYPTGSRILSEMNLSNKENLTNSAEICYSSSPFFIIGTVGTIMLKSTKIGISLYVIHICALLIFTVFVPFKHKIKAKEKVFNSKNIGDAITESIFSVLNICGYMVFFALINQVISDFSKNDNVIIHFIHGLVEFTAGIKELSLYDLPLISFLLSFGGICVITQCIGYLKQINVLHFIFTRIILGCIASVLCIIYNKTALYIPVIITLAIIILTNIIRRKNYFTY